MTDEEAEKKMSVLRAHVSRLKDDGFDSVQVFTTTYDEEEGVRHFSFGQGNFYTRFGHVSFWLEREKAAEWAKEIKND